MPSSCGLAAVFAGSPRYITNKLQCVLNAAARLVTGTHKFHHGLSHLLHEELHWLDVLERIHYKLGVTVHRYLQAPEYLVDCCTPVSDIPSRRHLRSATRHHLTVPRYCLSTFGRRTFSVAGPTVWNSLPDSLRDPALTSNSSRQSLKTNLFRRYQHTQRSRDVLRLRYINLLLTLTLTLTNIDHSSTKILPHD